MSIRDILKDRLGTDRNGFFGENVSESVEASDIIAPVLPLLRTDIQINETLATILGQVFLDVLQAHFTIPLHLLNPDPVRWEIGIVIGN